jgi:hypothetical protein
MPAGRDATPEEMLAWVLSRPRPPGEALRRRFAERLVQKCRASLGLSLDPDRVFVGGKFSARVNDAVVRRIAPSLAPCYFDPDPEERLAAQRLLDADDDPPPDEAYRASVADLPWEVRNRALRYTRTPLYLFHRPGAAVFACPEAHAVLDLQTGTEIAHLQSFSVPRAAVRGPIMDASGPLVIVRDRASERNIAHVLFDWLPRILHFAEARPELLPRAGFLVGDGRPPVIEWLIAGLGRTHGLSPAQFLTAESPRIFTSAEGVFGVSTIKSNNHPLNLTHPATVALVRRFILAQPLAAPAGRRRLYVSRADANRRRLLNEEQLCRALADRGFMPVCFTGMPIEQQIALACGAEAIVGIHGMGMAHILHHRGGLAVVELFPDRKGTFAYGAVSRALGFPYRHVVGPSAEGTPNDFTVDVGRVLAMLDELSVR